MSRSATHFTVFETAAGFCAIAWSGAGIRAFQLPATTEDAAARLMRRRVAEVEIAPAPEPVADIIAAATRYFAGSRESFDDVPLDLDGQSHSFRAIYEALRKIGWGATTSYGALAKELGAGPEFAREVGEAMARNPVPLIIPCHRVLAAGGKLGGFSAPGGVASKRRMLELEGVLVPPAQAPQASFDF